MVYLGTILASGLFARLFCSGQLLGASGVNYAVITMSLFLFPSGQFSVSDIWEWQHGRRGRATVPAIAG